MTYKVGFRFSQSVYVYYWSETYTQFLSEGVTEVTQYSTHTRDGSLLHFLINIGSS